MQHIIGASLRNPTKGQRKPHRIVVFPDAPKIADGPRMLRLATINHNSKVAATPYGESRKAGYVLQANGFSG
jgi:hypothetical protein